MSGLCCLRMTGRRRVSEYQDKLTRYAIKLWQERNPKKKLPAEPVGRIEADKGSGGCDTCGYGDGSGIFVYLDSVEVAEFPFYRLNEVLEGILNA